jgi:hypothetical protein
MRYRFDGWIAGLGTAGGTRIVVGCWPRSPFGPVTDVMVERPDGHRILFAPTGDLAGFVAATYTFDEVRIGPVTVSGSVTDWRVDAGGLRVAFTTGRRAALGALLLLVPETLAGRPGWVRLLDRPARVLRGVRTFGTAGNGRREFYGARDLHRIVHTRSTLDGVELGPLAPVDPPVRFGFGSTPRSPGLVRITTTVQTVGGT